MSEEVTISDLFEKESAELTAEDRKQIVDYLRARRHIWVEEEARARSTGKRAKLDAGAARKVKLDDLDLDDLVADL